MKTVNFIIILKFLKRSFKRMKSDNILLPFSQSSSYTRFLHFIKQNPICFIKFFFSPSSNDAFSGITSEFQTKSIIIMCFYRCMLISFTSFILICNYKQCDYWDNVLFYQTVNSKVCDHFCLFLCILP